MIKELKRRVDLFSLGKLGRKQKRKYTKQIKNTGLCEIDTWNFDITFADYMYRGLKLYYKNCKDIVNLEVSDIDYNGKKVSLDSCIRRMLFLLRRYLSTETTDKMLSDEFFDLLKACHPYLWW